MKPVRAAIVGVSGRMGLALLARVPEFSAVALAGAYARAGNAAVGAPAGRLVGRDDGPHVTDDLDAALDGAQVAVDFTLPGFTAVVADACRRAGCALVCGTTGLDAAGETALGRLAQVRPVLHASNMSPGITVALELARRATVALGDRYDVEIVEAHHRHKRDAPSGTALRLGAAVAAARGVALDEVADTTGHRDGAPRGPGRIGFASLRAGDIVGDHALIFAADGEVLEIRHRATRREIFADGAWRAAVWLAAQRPGRYGMPDVLGLDGPAA